MNFQTKGGSLRIQKNKSKITGEITSYTLSLVRNMRINSKPSHRRLALIGTYRPTELISRAAEIYRKLDRQVSKLTAEGVLWANDSSFIENQISKIVPRPAPVIKTPAIAPKSDYETYRDLIREVAEKAEKRLNAQGV